MDFVHPTPINATDPSLNTPEYISLNFFLAILPIFLALIAREWIRKITETQRPLSRSSSSGQKS